LYKSIFKNTKKT